MKPTIMSCAVTGNHTTREHHPDLPVTPEEIANAAIGAGKAGATIAHIHVRDPETGAPSMAVEYYTEVKKRIRDAGSDILINFTTGPGGRYVPDDDDPAIAGAGTNFKHPDIRVEHVVALKPDICSLDFNTMWFGSSAVINSPRNLRLMAEQIAAAGVKPELEVFDSGDIHLARELIDDGTIRGRPLFQIVTGVKYGMQSTPETLAYMKSLLPDKCEWAAFGIGRMEFPMVAQAWLLGGHTRVGMEDNVFIEKGVLAPDNAALVAKAAGIVRSLGGSLATVDETRAMLGI